MGDTAQNIEKFREFAKDRLQNHISELEPRYQNRDSGSPDIKTQAYREHRQIFWKELSDKMEELTGPDNRFLKPALGELRDRFLDKLKIDDN